jgi:hypothetical protein
MNTHTSNFRKNAKNPNAISIASGRPKWYSGPSYPKLFPPWALIKKYKKGLVTEEEYTIRYHNDVLSKLNPFDVYSDLEGKVLLCWEESGEFCHRHLVADWIFNKLGIEITEI